MPSDSLRRRALERLVALSVQDPSFSGSQSDIHRISQLCTQHFTGNGALEHAEGRDDIRVATLPISLRELEILVVLCKAAPVVQEISEATRLLHQLGPYATEIHQQSFRHTPLSQNLPPWETLTNQLFSAILSLASNHATLREQALSYVDNIIVTLVRKASTLSAQVTQPDDNAGFDVSQRDLPILQLAGSALGLLTAIADHVKVWSDRDRPKMVRNVRDMLSSAFLLSVERALSAVRNSRIASRPVREWKRWIRQYNAVGRNFGSVLLEQCLMNIVEASVAWLAAGPSSLDRTTLIDALLYQSVGAVIKSRHTESDALSQFINLIAEEINFLDDESDYLQLSSANQQRRALDIKASCLRSFLYCLLIDVEKAETEMYLSWLNTILSDPSQMAEDQIAQTALKCMAVLASSFSSIASSLTRSLPRLIASDTLTPSTARLAGDCLACALKVLSQDVVISTLYSLGNVLSASGVEKDLGAPSVLEDSNSNGAALVRNEDFFPVHSSTSLIAGHTNGSAEICARVVNAIVSVASLCKDHKITALTIAMLAQKIGRVSHEVDAVIIIETAAVGLCGGPDELRSLLRLYTRLASEATLRRIQPLQQAVSEARIRLSLSIKKDSPLYEVYMLHLLGICVSGGDTTSGGTVEPTLAAKVISQLFRPLAVLVSADMQSKPSFENEEELLVLSRDAWFNIAAHGFLLTSSAGKAHAKDLQTLARYTLPLIDEHRADMPESGIDLNTVLRRGAGAQNLNEQRASLLASLPHCETEIRGLSYSDSVFLNAALLVSTLRARGGDCTATLPYFLESKVKTGPISTCMAAISLASVEAYLSRAIIGRSQAFAAPHIALQLATFFEGCCHRISQVQQTATSAADRIIAQIPSSLCQKASLFALLELLNLMWQSCLDCETDEYSLKSHYHSARGNVHVILSDDVDYRRQTLARLHSSARNWVGKAIDWAPLDVKGLLQAYLEDYEDDGAYGHIALGRSFAVEMGATIPKSDQRLVILAHQHNMGVDTASDFIAQYTTRQQYRFMDRSDALDDEWTIVGRDLSSDSHRTSSPSCVTHETIILQALLARLRRNDIPPFRDIRDALRNAAGVLSRTKDDPTPLIQDLVAIPFVLFTKSAINLGVSLWLGVIKESPSLESRILAEVANGWEMSVRLDKGFFDARFPHLDPFFVKKEFAPSRWDVIKARQQHAHDILAPHLRLTQLLSSHFSSSRLTSPHIEQIYARLIRVTLQHSTNTVAHPLAREVHFHLILLALRLLKLCACLNPRSRWRLKDAILSTALLWFTSPPKWSFGSDKLQIKAEVRLLNDICNYIKDSGEFESPLMSAAKKRQDLLVQLLQQEIERLNVWISPLTHESKASITSLGSHSGAMRDVNFVDFVSTAWAEDPRIAICLAARFPTSPKLTSEIRTCLISDAKTAITIPDALPILLGESLASDVKEQLRYLLYWAPVNPIKADTYFLPAYENHPLLIQYALRALESHSVDIAFFYVPQIVQTLRYDVLGYVERYIIETAKFSQLFAHQIIWNMKANSFKDDDAQIPDPAKPILDKVTDALITSFSLEDREFYHREFDFFGKVTGISGTLKPFIKRPKPEKKQKIEEELRKIDVEVGVYLPSNPDGVVIGIDRKSGKPLQSHAKAPYMATFRIRKEEATPHDSLNSGTGEETSKPKTIETWQSAIFKVGDDCRQDLLALQLIAAFRGIFNQAGLDVYVFPYRVTATAPGCGVIDVLPNSISRDMLGREAVNGLYEYFVSKYGSEDSIRFQEARGNFIKSMAAYSIISYLLQFKDRHNGNIMIDDAGHLLHIDFGFCFDIAPGGIKFERAPFKLSPEMVAVMGGSAQSAPFRAFEELCVKVFLTARQHVAQLSHLIETMLDSGLPCFKPTTIQHFKERFVLEKTDREAADFVRKLVHWSERSYSTGVYDYFQLLTNGIPY